MLEICTQQSIVYHQKYAKLMRILLQYFIHAFRIMQKIAYTYGWQNLIDDVDEIDDETFAKMVTLLGVMMGVSSA